MATLIRSELLEQLPPHRGLWVALSGGLDSVVLLDLAVHWCGRNRQSLSVVHVHHGLSANADQWADFCARLCQTYHKQLQACDSELQLSFQCHRIRLSCDGTANLEARARDARYRIFETCLKPDDLLLMAHHADDQLETLLLRLMRGAGSKGLAGIPQQRALGCGQLYRPLLERSRAELEAYAVNRQLSWIEDESNDDCHFDRNFLRQQIIPQLKTRWPSAAQVAGRTALQLSSDSTLIQALASSDLMDVACSEQVLDCNRLQNLPRQRQRNLLYHWLNLRGCSPQQQHLDQILQTLINARPDAQPCFSRPGYQLRRYRHRLYYLPSPLPGTLPAPDLLSASIPQHSQKTQGDQEQQRSCALLTDSDLRMVSHGQTFLFRRQMESVSDGASIRLPESGVLMITARQGGERICLPGRGHKTIKHLVQEAGIPPWLRHQIRVFRWTDADTYSDETVCSDDGAGSDDTSSCIGIWSPAADGDPSGIFWWDCSLLTRSGDHWIVQVD